MKFIKIKNYVEKSFGCKPSFVIEMSDGLEYISNGCEFVERTDENIEQLITEYDCQEELEELLTADAIEMGDVGDASYMFRGCDSLTSVDDINMPVVTNITGMFFGCYNLISIGDINMPVVNNTNYLVIGCDRLISLGKIIAPSRLKPLIRITSNV